MAHTASSFGLNNGMASILWWKNLGKNSFPFLNGDVRTSCFLVIKINKTEVWMQGCTPYLMNRGIEYASYHEWTPPGFCCLEGSVGMQCQRCRWVKCAKPTPKVLRFLPINVWYWYLMYTKRWGLHTNIRRLEKENTTLTALLLCTFLDRVSLQRSATHPSKSRIRDADCP